MQDFNQAHLIAKAKAAASDANLILACQNHTLEKDADKYRMLVETMKAAKARLDEAAAAQTIVSQAEFFGMILVAASHQRHQTACALQEKRRRRERAEFERQALIAAGELPEIKVLEAVAA